MRKLSIFLALALVLTMGSAFAQTSVVSLGNVTEFSPTQLAADQTITMDIIYTAGDAPTSALYIYTNAFIIHGDADWGAVISSRLTLAQRQLVESGPMAFTTGIVHRYWHKVGGSGDPNFGFAGAGTDEAGVVLGPTPGNGTGADTVGILYGLTATSAADGWDVVAHGDGPRYQIEFTTNSADEGKFICIDSISQPLGAWEWAAGATQVFPAWDNGLGSDDTRCWEVFVIPNLGAIINNCPGNLSFSHCDVGTFDFDGEDQDDLDGTIGDFSIVSGPGSIDPVTGVWTWPDPPQSGNFVLEVQVVDGLGQSGGSCVVNITVTNEAPAIVCPGGSVTAPLGSTKKQTVSVSDDCDVLTVTVSDNGGAAGANNVIDNGDGTWDIEFTAASPDELNTPIVQTIEVSDGELTAECTITWDVIAGAPYALQIEKAHDVFQGQFYDLCINLNSYDPNAGLGGFDILVAYDASALSFQQATEGDIFAACGWEYFTYRYGAYGNCAGACPTGKARVVGIAETNNGPNHPSGCAIDYVPDVGDLPVSLACLRFLVSNDRTLECQYVPVRFCWFDCGDNTLSSADGSQLFLSDKVFDYVNDEDVFAAGQINDGSVGFPTLQGAQDECVFEDEQNGKIAIRNVDMQNGGIDIVCADSIDARGDINLNGVVYEIADAVMFTNYFVVGLAAFGSHIEGSIAASDVNADGLALSVADLVYLIRVVVGDALPYEKGLPMAVNYAVDNGVLRVDAPMGAAAVTVAGNVTPQNMTDNMDMSFAFDAEKNVTRVLVFSDVEGATGRTFSGNFLNAGGSIISVEFATYAGQSVVAKEVPTNFAVHQNYPNPFNPSTTVSFDITKAGDYTVEFFNVTGQRVETITGSSDAGTVNVVWNADRYASGIYFFKVTVGDKSETKKAVLIK